MKNIVILAIIAVVLVAGCTSQGFWSGYSTETTAESPDIINVGSPIVNPERIFNDDSFDIDFVIENTHDSRDVKDIGVWIENWNPCELKAVNGVTIEGGKAFYAGLEEGITKLTAGSSLPVGLTLTAKTPTDDLPGTCKIIYRLNHSFEAITVYNGITLMNSGDYRTLIKSGERPNEKPEQNIGTGPIRFVFETEKNFPVEAAQDRKITMNMKVDNLGTGVFGDIPVGAVSLKVPKDFLFLDENGALIDGKGPCDRFDRVETETSDSSITGNILFADPETKCQDGSDNDGDGFWDCADSDCKEKAVCTETELICDDDFDNDGNGVMDCGDWQCRNHVDCARVASCTLNNCNPSGIDCYFYSCGSGCICEGTEKQERYCNDNIDNDDDGDVDCHDSDCADKAICDTEWTCDDEIDNDIDTFVDCLDSDCDQQGICEYETELSCGDGEDNDGDGLIDCRDTDCDGIDICEYQTELSCGDGEDNDGDDIVDCFDDNCLEKSCGDNCICDADGIESTCDDGKDNDMDGLVDCLDFNCNNKDDCEYHLETNCGDGIDNDADGLIDCYDGNCYKQSCGSDCLCDIEVSVETDCNDDLDNDDDEKIDCLDLDCHSKSGCEYYIELTCTDGIDNDGDELVDLDDDDCEGREDLEVEKETMCDDGLDNDGDKLKDCGDWDCAEDPACLEIIATCSEDCSAEGCNAKSAGDGVVCHNGIKKEVNCADGLDNDGDNKIDCSDGNCLSQSCGIGCVCMPGDEYEPKPTTKESICDDEVDNDGDGKIDCLDSDCDDVAGCTYRAEICDDGMDNTGNQKVDCDDPECVDADVCQEEVVRPAVPATEYVTFTNDKKIPMVEGESITLRCEFNANVDIPYMKSYYIQANHIYEYEIRDTIEIDVEVQ